MKSLNPSQNLFMAITIFFLVLIVPLKAQDSPEDFLAAHNKARAAVGVGPLSWDETVAAYASNTANQHIDDCGNLQHLKGPYGENFAWKGDSMSGVEAVKMWVDEQSKYDYDSNTCAEQDTCGHYTQVVWKNSVRLGCAKVTCNDGQSTFITCNYDPPGNVPGEWPY